MQSREFRLKRRPVGMPTHEDFELATVEVPPPAAGEVRVRNLYMSLDPAMRGRMFDRKSYVPPYQLDEPLEGRAVGVVVDSAANGFAPGDLVLSELGWREAFTVPADRLQPHDPAGLPPQAVLGIAGLSGLTAYIGIARIAQVKAGDTVFVSAASGAVGSAACVMAQHRGARVIGSAGGPEKAAFLRDELRLDEVIDYKAVPNLTKALAAAAPQGIDVFFDNVGGDQLEAAIAIANPFARFAICGAISGYNATTPPTAPRNLMLIPSKRLRLEGYIAFDHEDLRPQFLADIRRWHEAGTLVWKETVYEGVDRAVDAFLGLFTGANIGKMLVKLG